LNYNQPHIDPNLLTKDDFTLFVEKHNLNNHQIPSNTNLKEFQSFNDHVFNRQNTNYTIKSNENLDKDILKKIH